VGAHVWLNMLNMPKSASERITMHCQWEGNPKIALFPWDFVILQEEDQTTAIGNMHKKFGKDRTLGSGDILLGRETDVTDATDHNSSPPLPRAK